MKKPPVSTNIELLVIKIIRFFKHIKVSIHNNTITIYIVNLKKNIGKQ